MASSVASTLSSASTQVAGVSGILMAVPQIAGILGLGGSQPQNTIGYQPQSSNGASISPPAIIFHYEGRQSLKLQSDITDHPIETNSFIQDGIALKPVEVYTHGFVGELTTALPPGAVGQALAVLQVAANKLTLVGGVVPALTLAAQETFDLAQQAATTAINAANAAVSAFSSIAGNSGEAVFNGTAISNANAFANGTGSMPTIGSQGKQQLYFQQFLGYWNQRTLFTVQTPWGVFQNMAILDVIPVQDDDTQLVTDFDVKFKQISFASIGATSTASQITAPIAGTGAKNYYQVQPATTASLGNLSSGPSLSSVLGG